MDFYRQTFELSPDGLLVVGNDGRIVRANARANGVGAGLIGDRIGVEFGVMGVGHAVLLGFGRGLGSWCLHGAALTAPGP